MEGFCLNIQPVICSTMTDNALWRELEVLSESLRQVAGGDVDKDGAIVDSPNMKETVREAIRGVDAGCAMVSGSSLAATMMLREAEDAEKAREVVSLDDPFDLTRFAVAYLCCFDSALKEIEQGRKVSHWSWFILPTPSHIVNGVQVGSAMNKKYALRNDEETKAFLTFSYRGIRLRSTYLRILLAIAVKLEQGLSAPEILGHNDAPKLLSSVRHFHRVSMSVSDDEVSSACHRIRKAVRDPLLVLGPYAVNDDARNISNHDQHSHLQALMRATQGQPADWIKLLQRSQQTLKQND